MKKKKQNLKRTLLLFFITITIALNTNLTTINATETTWRSPTNYPLEFNEWGAPENVFDQDDSYSGSQGDSRLNEQTWYEFDFPIMEISGTPTINFITVRFDAYASGTSANYDIKLTWDLGNTYTSAKTSSNLPTSDTDTYIEVGGNNWGRTWSKDDFDDNSFGIYFKANNLYRTYYCDHIQVKINYTYITPGPPDSFHIDCKEEYCNVSTFNFIKGTGADYTLIRASSEDYPTITEGIQLYNSTYNSFEINYDTIPLTWDTEYYICGFSWNTTYNCWGENEEDWFFTTPCNNKISVTNNTENTTGNYTLTYETETGYNLTLNFRGETGECLNCSDCFNNTNFTTALENWLENNSYINEGDFTMEETILFICWIIAILIIFINKYSAKLMGIIAGMFLSTFMYTNIEMFDIPEFMIFSSIIFVGIGLGTFLEQAIRDNNKPTKYK